MRYRDLGEKSLRKLKLLSSSICEIEKNNCLFLFLLFKPSSLTCTAGAEVKETELVARQLL